MRIAINSTPIISVNSKIFYPLQVCAYHPPPPNPCQKSYISYATVHIVSFDQFRMQQHNARSAPVTPTVKQIKHRLKYCVFLEISPALIAQICIDGAWNSIITSLNHILWCHHSSKSVWKCNIWWMWVCVHVPTTMFLEIYVSHDNFCCRLESFRLEEIMRMCTWACKILKKRDLCWIISGYSCFTWRKLLWIFMCCCIILSLNFWFCAVVIGFRVSCT